MFIVFRGAVSLAASLWLLASFFRIRTSQPRHWLCVRISRSEHFRVSIPGFPLYIPKPDGAKFYVVGAGGLGASDSS
jgi:hypothetical protein